MISLILKKNILVKLVLLNLLFVVLIAINFTACCAYSFTGASVPEHLKTIAIPIADDRSGSGEPGLREDLTQTLIEKFINDLVDKSRQQVTPDGKPGKILVKPAGYSEDRLI